MSVNFAEKNLFNYLEEYFQKNPPKPLDEQTIEEFRASAAFFKEFTGDPANISFIEQTITARDGYKIPIRIYNHEIIDTSPALVMYPGCGYVLDLFESMQLHARG